MLLITAVHCRVPEHITHISVGATRSMQTRWGGKKRSASAFAASEGLGATQSDTSALHRHVENIKLWR